MKSIALLLFTIPMFLLALVKEPLYIYLLENLYPYNFALYDLVAKPKGTLPQSKLHAYASLQYKDVGNTRSISIGKLGDTTSSYAYRSSSSASSHSAYKLLRGSSDTVSSIHLYHDQNRVDTASAEYRHQGFVVPDLKSYQKYLYRQDCLLDSMHYQGFEPGSVPGAQTSRFFYSSRGRLDSVINTKQHFGYRFRNLFVYDSTNVLQYEEYYEYLGFGDQYFGRDVHRRSAPGQIVITERYVEVGGTYYLYQVLCYFQSQSINLREVDSPVVELYPNPVSNFLFIQGLDDGVYHYKIYNQQGQLISKGEMGSEGIEARQMDKGYYILELIAPLSARQIRAGFIRN